MMWTKEETDILVQLYSKLGPAEIAYKLNRSKTSVKNKAQQLGLIYRQVYNGWSEDELSILKHYYPIEGKYIAERLPNKTLKNIQITAFRLDIKKEFGDHGIK